ncbi:MAG TPA: MBL fold metallo-hydrolase [bacterium]|nr:MBL fold metallo-hydrolase [bacterium]
MEVQLVRHATLLVTMHGLRILVDPMLGEVGAAPAVANSPNPRPNPLTPLPLPVPAILQGVAAVLVTHTHRDHFDEAAARLVPKSLPLFGQPEDEPKFAGMGFADVRAVRGTAHWNGIEFHRTAGRHGTGEIGRRMAPVSGFVLSAPGEPTLYIAGDTIWCEEVEGALREFAPSATVVNAGAAQFLEGDPITMTAQDVIATARSAPATRVVAVHMEAINHCLLARAQLHELVRAGAVADRVWIPRDGEALRV